MFNGYWVIDVHSIILNKCQQQPAMHHNASYVSKLGYLASTQYKNKPKDNYR